MFEKLINDNIGDYSYYVIMPANLEGTAKIIERLPSDKVYILDQTNTELAHYPSVYQNFKKDIYNGLSDGLSLINKYNKIILIFSEDKQPLGLLEGFKLFCSHHGKSHEVINSVKARVLNKGELFVVLEDKDLIRIIKNSKELHLKLVKDIGIISYNDTLLKEIVEGGITTISTDFNSMGTTLAQMILNNKPANIENPNHLIIRKSL
jgi:DNA-binding LacI/PurR family transcriptional regulator